MTKLIVFDYPVLISESQDAGALSAVESLRSSGWTIALVSNQGHCDASKAREDIQATADLFGIELAAFCPVEDGSEMASLAKINGQWKDSRVTPSGFEALFGVLIPDINFWLPSPGMLTYLKSQRTFRPSRCVLIGETADQNFAADRGGFEFIYADDWRCDRVTVE